MTKQKSWYFVRFSDGAIYAAGPQHDCNGHSIPGGPIAFALESDAATMAKAIGGTVITRTIETAAQKAKTAGFVLWVKSANGRYSYVEETLPSEPAGDRGLIRLEGQERQAAIAASRC